jgi:hypothetical protein
MKNQVSIIVSALLVLMSFSIYAEDKEPDKKDEKAKVGVEGSQVPVHDWKLSPLSAGPFTPWELIEGAKRLAANDLRSVEILNLARPLYNHKRAILKERFQVKGSKLSYPDSTNERCWWSVISLGDKLFAEASCADKMYGARFLFEFKKERGDHWVCSGIYGSEHWKGE